MLSLSCVYWIDSCKSPGRPYESLLEQSQVNWRGGGQFDIGTVFLSCVTFLWPEHSRQVQVVLYWPEQWCLGNYCCGFNSQASGKSFGRTIHSVIWGLCWKNEKYQTSQQSLQSCQVNDFTTASNFSSPWSFARGLAILKWFPHVITARVILSLVGFGLARGLLVTLSSDSQLSY